MENKKSISEYFAKILTLMNWMKNNGDKPADLTIIGKISRTLPPIFDDIVEESNGLNGMPIDEFVGNRRVCNRRNNNKIFYDFHQGSMRKNHKSVVEVYTFLTIDLLTTSI